MSTGAQCNFNQTEPSTWNYQLQQYPYGETRDFYTYGPFRTFAEAHEHLQNTHANPGGFMVNFLEGFECPHDETESTQTIVKGKFVDATECRQCGRLI